MIIASLLSRPVRTLVSVLAVALEVTMILVIVGLTTGITNESGRRVVGTGADIMLQGQGSSIMLALSTANMPIAIGDKVRSEVTGVKAVAPVLIQTNTQGGLDLVYGIDPPTFAEVGPFIWVKGGIFKSADEIVVDDLYAKSKKLDIGTRMDLLNHTFTVSGIVENGRGARLFLSLPAMQEMFGAGTKVSTFFIKTNSTEAVPAVQKALEGMLPGYRVTNLAELMSQMTPDKIPGLEPFLKTVVVIAVCVGVLVIFLSMYTTITERTREIGILRSLGGSKIYVVRLIFEESIFICLIGVVVGILASEAISAGIIKVFPTLIIMITNEWRLKAAGFALLSGVIGSFYPSLKAAKLDPIEALAYE